MKKAKDSLPLSFIEALNEESQWQNDKDAVIWLSAFFAAESNGFSPGAQALENFRLSLKQMRNTLAAFHFEKTADLSWLKVELNGFRLDFDFSGARSALPPLQAFNQGLCLYSKDAQLLEKLRAFLLLDFAFELSRSLASGLAPSIQRCEGLYKEPSAASIMQLDSVSFETELAWRKEISLLCRHDLETKAGIQRCADLFKAAASAKSRFCSDKCRFNTFQIQKQLNEPDYLAEKQRRYRKKKS